jgi:hypothetical protein
MLSYFTINTTAETICFLIALFCLTRDNSITWRSMVLFLFITCVIEMLGIHFKHLFLADRVHVHQNVWLYNILIIFQASFLSFMFQNLLNNYFNSKPIIFGGLILLTALYIYEIINHGVFIYNEKTNTVMLVLVVIYSLVYYYYLFKDDTYINLTYFANFWWVAGLLLFYFGSTVSNIFFDNLSPYKAVALRDLSSSIFKALNILLYSCWSYSFICRRWQTKTSEGLS